MNKQKKTVKERKSGIKYTQQNNDNETSENKERNKIT